MKTTKVGAVLRVIRKSRKLSQRELADELRVSQREVSFVERGERKHLYMIGKVLQFYILTEDEIESLIWAQVSDFLASVGLSDVQVEKIKAEHSLMRRFGQGTRIKKILASFKEGAYNGQVSLHHS